MTNDPNADQWLSDQLAGGRVLPLPCYAVFRHQQTQIDYMFRPGVFRLITSPDHYFFLAYGGLITVPHGSAQAVDTNYIEFLRAEAIATGGTGSAVDNIIYPSSVTEQGAEDSWPGDFTPDEQSLQTVREWARANGIDRREAA